ncbi:MAG TPA: hypothetical protein VFV10_17800 [Gammaproteobacteria bacterium]|nr:hypothetical protein [Gammaproteobacteria bacterium]
MREPARPSATRNLESPRRRPSSTAISTSAVWQTSAVVDDLHQVNRVEYSAPPEKTEIFLLYDDDALYVGAKLYDTDPAADHREDATPERQHHNVSEYYSDWDGIYEAKAA